MDGDEEIPQRVWEKMGANQMCYHNNQQANRQTKRENPRVMLPKVKSCDNNQLQCWKRCKHWETDRHRDGQTDKAKRILLPKFWGIQLDNNIAYVRCINKMHVQIKTQTDIYNRKTGNVKDWPVLSFPKSSQLHDLNSKGGGGILWIVIYFKVYFMVVLVHIMNKHCIFKC